MDKVKIISREIDKMIKDKSLEPDHGNKLKVLLKKLSHALDIKDVKLAKKVVNQICELLM